MCKLINKSQLLLLHFSAPSESSPVWLEALLLQSINFGLGSVEEVLKVTCQLLHEIRQTVTTGRPSPVMIVQDKDIQDQKNKIDQMVQNSNTIYGDKDKPNI